MVSTHISQQPQKAPNRNALIDLVTIERAINLMVEPHAVVEVRILDAGRSGTVSGYFNDPTALARSVAEWNGKAPGINVTLNPVNPALQARAHNRLQQWAKATTGDADIANRQHLLIDLDPVRPSGVSSSDAEHEKALDRAEVIRDFLTDQGWPEPLVADSGNGAHLVYRIDEPNDDAARRLIDGVLKAIDLLFSDDAVVVDTSVGNAARLTKVYGTLAAKGDDIPERPHRLSRIISAPQQLECVPHEKLVAMTSLLPTAPAEDRHGASDGLFDLRDWLQQHGIDVRGPLLWSAAGSGAEKWILPVCPWNAEHTNSAAYIVRFANGALAAGCHHNSCQGKGWHDLRALYEPAWERESHGLDDSADSADSAGELKRDWEPPQPLDDFTLPTFPVEALPPWLRNFCEATAEATQTPVDLPSVLVLSALATTSAGKFEVRITADWREPLNLFTVVAMVPGTRKSAVFNAVATPITEYERLLIKETASAIANAEMQRDVLKGRLQKLQQEASRVNDGGHSPSIEEAEQLNQEVAACKVPARPRLIADDVSPEKLASMMAEQSGRMAILSPEGEIFDIVGGRYSASGAANLGVLLKGHAGDQLRVDRVGRPAEFIPRPALTLGLAVQPDVLSGLAGKPGFRGRGLLARFLYAIPKNPLGRRRIDAPSVPPAVTGDYRAGLTALLRHPIHVNEFDEPMTDTLLLSAAAKDRLQAFQTWLEPQLSEFGDLGTMTDWGGKLVGAVARIAGLLHLAEHARTDQPWRVLIAEETMTRAVSIGNYLIPHARAAFAHMGADPVVEDARRVLRWLAQYGGIIVSKRDIFNALRSRFSKITALDPVLSLLEQHGYIRFYATPERIGPGRKPSPEYEVNPMWAPHNPHNPQNGVVLDGSSFNADLDPVLAGAQGRAATLLDVVDPIAAQADAEWEEVVL